MLSSLSTGEFPDGTIERTATQNLIAAVLHFYDTFSVKLRRE